MKFTDIDIDSGTYVNEGGILIDALSSVYMIEWVSCKPSYVEICALAKASSTCPNCQSAIIEGVSVLTNEGEVYSCEICRRISRNSNSVVDFLMSWN